MITQSMTGKYRLALNPESFASLISPASPQAIPCIDDAACDDRVSGRYAHALLL